MRSKMIVLTLTESWSVQSLQQEKVGWFLLEEFCWWSKWSLWGVRVSEERVRSEWRKESKSRMRRERVLSLSRIGDTHCLKRLPDSPASFNLFFFLYSLNNPLQFFSKAGLGITDRIYGKELGKRGKKKEKKERKRKVKERLLWQNSSVLIHVPLRVAIRKRGYDLPPDILKIVIWECECGWTKCGRENQM